MTKAIFEILFLLSVSCLIGILFTYLFWRAKYRSLAVQCDQLKLELASANGELKSMQLKASELSDRLAAVNTPIKPGKAPAKSTSSSDKKDKEAIKAYKHTISLLNEQMEEKEREIEVLSQELETRKISYYKIIEGKRYKNVTLRMADEAVAGQGDGRISMEDAEKIFDTISDGKAYTQVEKDTMRYLRDNYHWTDPADELFRKKVRSWAAKGHELDG